MQQFSIKIYRTGSVTTITVYPYSISVHRSALTAANHPVWGAGNCGARVTLATSDSDCTYYHRIIRPLQPPLIVIYKATPTISIAGVVTNLTMSLNTSSTVWEYRWEVPSSITTGSFSVTVGGQIRQILPILGQKVSLYKLIQTFI